jgi:hypothetical protein
LNSGVSADRPIPDSARVRSAQGRLTLDPDLDDRSVDDELDQAA